MKKIIKQVMLTMAALPALSFSAQKVEYSDAVVANEIFKKAQTNGHWKSAFLTGKHAQIVFMSVSPSTNPTNEIGMETHKFDQVILVVEGDGEAILGGKKWMVKKDDVIFIPEGVAHNILNLSKKEPLKIISFYSNTDIPAKAEYKTKADEAQ